MNPRQIDLYPFGQEDEASLISGGTAFEEVMYSINADQQIGRDLARFALHDVLSSKEGCRDARLGALLMGSVKIATPQMVAGFVDAVFDYEESGVSEEKKSIKLKDNDQIVGCAGSGKKGAKTINITTPAMVIAAAAEAKVIKAGSRASSSLTGSSDIMEMAGFRIPESEENSTRLFQETNFGFYSIEHLTPNFDKIYGSKFYAPHALSFVLPAMLLPVRTDSIFYGYAGPNVSLSASSFVELGYPSVLVCNNTSDGIHYIDEMATKGTTNLAGAINGVVGRKRSFDAASYMNLDRQVGPGIETRTTLKEQLDIFRDVIGNRVAGSVAENTVCINAATMLYLAKRAENPKEGFSLAQAAIRNGSAADKLHEIIEASWRNVQ